MDRRRFLGLSGAAAVQLAAGPGWANAARGEAAASLRGNQLNLTIERLKIELAHGVEIPTVGYNGMVPGPILRLKEGVPVMIDVENRTGVDELVHWHGLHIESLQDGSMEEGSPVLPAGGRLQYRFTPAPTGTRWYHTHAMAMEDLQQGGYSGQFGFLYVEPKNEPGRFDCEVFMAIHHWGPSLMEMGNPEPDPMVGYRYASFNDKMLGAGEPLRVKRGERVMFRFLNASGSQNTAIALPGHTFEVIALDGNLVPSPHKVKTLQLGVAERIDAIVEMNAPGVWVLGATDEQERASGLGQVIEYAGHKGKARWDDPGVSDWSYHLFQDKPAARLDAMQVEEIFPMVFKRVYLPQKGMDVWMINSASFPKMDPLRVIRGKKYRLQFMNASREDHPVHLHRHSFELKSITGVPTNGIIKDTVVVPKYGSVEVDFVADNPGRTLFHCHQQIHMDYGFMQLIEYV
ncbi:MAG: Multicopper oxidase [Acidobacteriaceae bacterium]|nr:Multicopper oxidase [Acidobacteriaceae bacterium]